jgi:cardiolipin synthase
MITSLPNLLTLSRIGAIPVLVALFFVPAPTGPWLALAVFALAGVTDFLDGHIARRRQLQSRLGVMLDPIADKLLVSSIIFLLVAFGRVEGPHIIPAAVILCREIIVSGLREFLATLQVGMPVSRLSKWKTAIQMVAMAFLILGNAGPPGTEAVGLIALWVAAALTLVTGYTYFRGGLRHATIAPAPEPLSWHEPDAESDALDHAPHAHKAG